jgi:DNA-binding transcriptional MerR regulator
MNINNSNSQSNRPPPPIPNERQQQQEKKSRGNRRDQRFRRQCRARGMKPAKIEKLLQNRNQMDHNNHQITTGNRQNMTINQGQTNVLNQLSATQRNNPLNPITTTTATMNQNKRKRDVSLQELQTNSTIPKSTRNISTIPLKKMTNIITDQNYRFVFIV